jgi:hypothetical protein
LYQTFASNLPPKEENMMNPQMEMRPPYITWKVEQVEDRAASLETGHYVSRDIHYAHVTRPGQKDTLVKEANDFIKDSFDGAKSGRIPAAWAEHYKSEYERWKAGTTGDVKGTPIKGWPALGPAAQEMLIRAGVQTVEDLADYPDGSIQNLGMGAIAYKQKAVAWLMSAKDIGKTAETLAALQVKVDAQQKFIDELLAQQNAKKAA